MSNTYYSKFLYTSSDGTPFTVRVYTNDKADLLTMELRDGLFSFSVPRRAVPKYWDEIEKQLPFFFKWIENNVKRYNLVEVKEEFPTEIEAPYNNKKYTVCVHHNENIARAEAIKMNGSSFIMHGPEGDITCIQLDDKIHFYGATEHSLLSYVTLQFWGGQYARKYLPDIAKRVGEDLHLNIGTILVHVLNKEWVNVEKFHDAYNINISWRCMLMPPEIFEFACKRELTRISSGLTCRWARKKTLEGLAKLDPEAERKDYECNNIWRKLPWWMREQAVEGTKRRADSGADDETETNDTTRQETDDALKKNYKDAYNDSYKDAYKDAYKDSEGLEQSEEEAFEDEDE